MHSLDVWAVLVAAASAFALGGLWYGPLFGKAWWREVGGGRPAPVASAGVFAGAALLSLLSAVVFAAFLGPRPGLGLATAAGFAAGLAWVAASFGINYLFARRSLRLFLIDGGYHTLQFTLYGIVLGAWPG